MCGIAGIFDREGFREFDHELLSMMNQTQFHRGPDEGGQYHKPGVALAHRRLSIIDRSAGQQPMHSLKGDITVVFNGEIYNFPELTVELRKRGYEFRTHCDTEVILYAWEEWGEACVSHFRGMFAFAIYDHREECLFLARDRLGIKPLYYAALSDGSFIFGSELKVLKPHPELSRKVDYEAIEDYFALGYIPEPRTIYRSAKKLKPGHCLLVKKNQPLPDPVEYWDVTFSPRRGGDAEGVQEELVERLREAVRIRLVAEVPLGAFLSGGVDSSAVVAMMAQLMEDPVNTCAIGFDVKQFNETEFARLVADRYHTNHHEETVSSDDFDLLDKLANLYDEPFADSSAIPTYRVCELAKKRVTVALSGDGGDENFAGYRRYRWHMNEEKLRSTIPDAIRRPLFGTMGQLYPKLDWAPKVLRAKSTLQSIGRDAVSAYLHTVSITTDDQRERLFTERLKGELQSYSAVDCFFSYLDRKPIEDPLSMIQYLDIKTYLPGDILTKVDRASMAHALEVRVPLLDHKFVEWAATLPPEMKLQGQEGKYILKKALEPYLPSDVLYRSKMGFGVPLAKWFRGPLKGRVRALLYSEVLIGSGLFSRHFIEHVVEHHIAGIREYSALIWALLMFDACAKNLELEL